ncbi:MAG: M48 family metallopeptidase [Candidatus Paceibacterota bacterium]
MGKISLILIATMLSQSCALKGQKADPPTAQQQKSDYKKPPKPNQEYPGDHWDVENIGLRDVAQGMNFFSLEKEIAIGKQYADEIEKNTKIIDDPVIAEYVNRLGQNLVRSSDAKVPFTIKVIDDPEVNAFALPGGFFFVNSGLIMKADEEAELAGVMAHEIAHVAARHGTRQVTKAKIIDIASIPLIFMGGWAGYGIRQAAGFAIPITFLKFSRNFEREADELGTQYMYKAGYDPTMLASFFEKLQAMQKRKQGKMSKIFSSHPSHESRMAFIQSLLSVKEVFAPKTEYVVSTSEFAEVRARLERQTNINNKNRQEDPDRPTLRRKDTDKIEVPEDGKTTEEEEDERPTIKRK